MWSSCIHWLWGSNLEYKSATIRKNQLKSWRSLLYSIAVIPVDEGGSSAMTVFRPMLEMSLSCSLLDTMFEQRVSTIVSTWHSFTFPTKGPRLHKPKIMIITNYNGNDMMEEDECKNTIWQPDSALLHFCPPEVWATWSRLSSRSPHPVWSNPFAAPSSGHWLPWTFNHFTIILIIIYYFIFFPAVVTAVPNDWSGKFSYAFICKVVLKNLNFMG